MTQYVNPKYIQYALSKIRKSSNFQYQQAIRRNKKGLVRTSPLGKLMDFLNSRNYSEAEKENIVVEYWEKVAENPTFEKEIAEQFKIRYIKKTKDNIQHKSQRKPHLLLQFHSIQPFHNHFDKKKETVK